MTERTLFADCHEAVDKGFSYFFYNRISLPTAVIGRWQRFFYFFSKQKFFGDCLCWQMANDSLRTVFFGRWQRTLCRLLLLARGKAVIVHNSSFATYFPRGRWQS